MKPIRLLITARDVGTAMHLAPVVRKLAGSTDFDVKLVATDAAAAWFTRGGLDFQKVEHAPPYVAAPTREQRQAINTEAATILRDFAPDIVLSGMSSYPGGIDDAMQLAAREIERRPVTALLIDTPGLYNPSGGNPDLFLTTTEQSLSWAKCQTGSAAHLIGAPKYEALMPTDLGRLQAETRAALRLGPEEKVCVFIAQGSEVPGHDEGFQAVARALAGRRGHPLRLVIRPHPSFPETAAAYERFAVAHGLTPIMDRGENAIGTLCIASGVITCTSTATQDYLWLTYRYPQLSAVLVHVLIAEPLRHYLAAVRSGWIPYAAEVGAAVLAKKESELPSLLDAMAGEAPAPDRKRWLPDIADPVGRTVEVLCAAVRAADVARH